MDKFEWTDIVDGKTEASGEPINRIAKVVQENRNFLNALPTDFELQKNKNIAGGYAGLDENNRLFREQMPDELEKAIKMQSINPLYGKKVGFFGDSICYGNGYVGGYAKMIGEKNNMVVKNLGVGSTYLTSEVAGSTIITSVNGVRTVWTTLTNGSFDSAKVDFSLTDDFGTIRYCTRLWNKNHHQYDYTEITETEWDGSTQLFIYRPSIAERINFIDEDCDYIIGEGGINDITGGLWIGEHTEGYDSEIDIHSVIGGTELLCRNMLKRFPGKKLGFILIHKVKDYPFTVPPNADGTQGYYFNEIKKVFAKYSIPVLDLYNSSGLNTGIPEFLQYTYNNDGFHPNEEGYRLFYLDKIEKWMGTLYSADCHGTVEDGSITKDKLATDVIEMIDAKISETIKNSIIDSWEVAI